MKHFYNTISLNKTQLNEEIENAKKQNDKIMIFFKNYPDREFTPFEVWSSVFGCRTPITSVRRSLTNLTELGQLEKTDNQKKGDYGKLNYTWVLKSKSRDLQTKLF